MGGQEDLEKLKSLLTVHNRLEGPAASGSTSQQHKCSGFAPVLRCKMTPERLALSPPWPVRPFKTSEAHRASTSVPGRKKRQQEKAGHPVIGIWQPLKNVRSQICVPRVLSAAKMPALMKTFKGEFTAAHTVGSAISVLPVSVCHVNTGHSFPLVREHP